MFSESFKQLFEAFFFILSNIISLPNNPSVLTIHSIKVQVIKVCRIERMKCSRSIQKPVSLNFENRRLPDLVTKTTNQNLPKWPVLQKTKA